jgi:hypothetical protein
MLASMGEAPTPAAVWDMIRRADDSLKYAPNRDPGVARGRAREQLESAIAAAETLEDRAAGQTLARQARTRLQDLDRLEA